MMMMMMMMRMRMRLRRRMILKSCLLQNLQTIVDLEIVVQEIKVVVMENNEVMFLPISTVEELQKIGLDGIMWQLVAIGNNAPFKEIHGVGWCENPTGID